MSRRSSSEDPAARGIGYNWKTRTTNELLRDGLMNELTLLNAPERMSAEKRPAEKQPAWETPSGSDGRLRVAICDILFGGRQFGVGHRRAAG
jgi:hypothetical protein